MDIKIASIRSAQLYQRQAFLKVSEQRERSLNFSPTENTPRFEGRVSKGIAMLALFFAPLSANVLGRPPEAVKPGIQMEKPSLVSKLDFYIPNPSLNDQYQSLRSAAAEGDTQTVLRLIRKLNNRLQDAGGDSKGLFAWISLLDAVESAHPETVLAILNLKGQPGFNFDEKLLSANDWTLFDRALGLGNSEIVKAFYRAHEQGRYAIDLDHRNKDNITAFMLAVYRGNKEALELTLQEVAAGHLSFDFNQTTPSGQTPLMMALAIKEPEIVNLFLNYMEIGVLKPNMMLQESKSGYNTLMLAFWMKNIAAAERIVALYRAGKIWLDLQQTDTKGLRVDDYALYRGATELAKILQEEAQKQQKAQK